MSKKQTPETAIKKQIKDWLTLNGWFHFQYPAGIMGYPGACDRIAIKNGIVLFIEIKAAKGKQSVTQKEFQCKVEAAGGFYIITNGYEDIELFTKNHNKIFGMYI